MNMTSNLNVPRDIYYAMQMKRVHKKSGSKINLWTAWKIVK